MLGANPDMGAMLLIVTEDKVSPRIFEPEGIKAGLLDFDLALQLLRNDSMKGSFTSAKQSELVTK